MVDRTRQLLERGAGAPPDAPDFDALWQRGRRQRRAIQIVTGGTAVAVVVAAAVIVPRLAGGPAPGMPAIDQPAGASDSTILDDAELRELQEQTPPVHSPRPAGPMNIDPDEASPGDTLELTFPEETSRGVNYVLQELAGDGTWQDVAYLFTSDKPGNNGSAILIEDVPENFGFTSQGRGGPGPDFAILPAEIEAGDYRICEAQTLDEPMCAQITVR